jgi:hypothetical protein
MSMRLNMKFTGSNSVQRITPVMKIQKTAPPTQPTPAQQQQQARGGRPVSSWRAAYGSGGSYSLKSSCGCGGGG